MRVLIHQSHFDPNKPDGWSGAPGEATWVRMDLIPKIQAGLWAKGITPVLAPGDLADHIQFHEDYDAFIAPHYEANVHVEGGALVGGSFWGRATLSTTGVKDDLLGSLFWTRYTALAGKPQDRFGWTNPNVTDYYGFRLTTDKTPGILVEHGVGAPGAPDYLWLRNNVQKIADVWVDALATFGGVAGPFPSVPAPVMSHEQKTDRLLQKAEANEALVWIARLQRGLDVETGKPYNAAVGPLDPRIKQ